MQKNLLPTAILVLGLGLAHAQPARPVRPAPQGAPAQPSQNGGLRRLLQSGVTLNFLDAGGRTVARLDANGTGRGAGVNLARAATVVVTQRGGAARRYTLIHGAGRGRLLVATTNAQGQLEAVPLAAVLLGQAGRLNPNGTGGQARPGTPGFQGSNPGNRQNGTPGGTKGNSGRFRNRDGGQGQGDDRPSGHRHNGNGRRGSR